MFWLIVRLIKKYGGHTRFGCQRLKIGPFDVLTSTRTEMNREGWLLQGKGSEMAGKTNQRRRWGKKIRQIVVVAPRAPIAIFKIFEKYEDFGKSYPYHFKEVMLSK